MLSQINFDMIILKENNIIITNDSVWIYPLEPEKPEHAFWFSNGPPHICYFKMCHVEDNGERYECTIYTLMSPSEPNSDMWLYCDGEEYEGLCPNTYSLVKDDHLYDSDTD